MGFSMDCLTHSHFRAGSSHLNSSTESLRRQRLILGTLNGWHVIVQTSVGRDNNLPRNDFPVVGESFASNSISSIAGPCYRSCLLALLSVLLPSCSLVHAHTGVCPTCSNTVSPQLTVTHAHTRACAIACTHPLVPVRPEAPNLACCCLHFLIYGLSRVNTSADALSSPTTHASLHSQSFIRFCMH
jgi:hypothetical protein